MSQSSRDRYRNSNLNNVLARPAASNAPIGPRFSSGLVPLGGPKRTRSAGAPAAKVTVPKPVNLPSLKKENAGHDPSTQIVPTGGGGGWQKPEDQAAAAQAGPGPELREAALTAGSNWASAPARTTSASWSGPELGFGGPTGRPGQAPFLARDRRLNASEYPSLATAVAQSSQQNQLKPPVPTLPSTSGQGALNWDEDERQVSAPLSGRPGATADRAKSFDEDDRPFVRREEPQFRPWEEPHVEGYSSWRGSGREDAAPSYGRSLSADRQREPYGLPRSERDMFGPPQRGPARGPDVEDRWGSRGSQSRDSFGPDRQSDARRPLQDRPLQDRDSFNRGPDYSRFNGPPPARFDRYRSEEYIPAYVEDPTLFPPPPPPRHGSSPRARGGSAQQQAEIGRGEASTHAEDMERQAFLEELDRVAADLEKEQVRKKEEAEAAAAAAAAAAAEAEAAERAAAEEAERKAAAAKLLIAPTSFASVIVPEGEKPPEGTSQAKPRTRFKPLDEEDEEEKQRKAAAAAKLRELEERMAQRAAAAEAERLAKEAAAAAQAAEAAQAEVIADEELGKDGGEREDQAASQAHQPSVDAEGGYEGSYVGSSIDVEANSSVAQISEDGDDQAGSLDAEQGSSSGAAPPPVNAWMKPLSGLANGPSSGGSAGWPASQAKAQRAGSGQLEGGISSAAEGQQALEARHSGQPARQQQRQQLQVPIPQALQQPQAEQAGQGSLFSRGPDAFGPGLVASSIGMYAGDQAAHGLPAKPDGQLPIETVSSKQQQPQPVQQQAQPAQQVQQPAPSWRNILQGESAVTAAEEAAAAALEGAAERGRQADRGGRGGRGRGRGKGGRDALAKDTVLKDAGAAGERMRGEKAERGRSRGRGARKGARSQNGDNEATLEAEPEEPTHEAPDLTDPRPKKAQRGPGKAEAEPQAGQPGAAAGAAGNARTAPHNAAPNAQVPTRGRNRNAAKNAVARPNANASVSAVPATSAPAPVPVSAAPQRSAAAAPAGPPAPPTVGRAAVTPTAAYAQPAKQTPQASQAPSAAPSHFAWGANLAQEVASIAQLSLEEPITRKNNSLSPMLDPVAPLGPATEGRAVDRPKSAQSGVVSRPRSANQDVLANGMPPLPADLTFDGPSVPQQAPSASSQGINFGFQQSGLIPGGGFPGMQFLAGPGAGASVASNPWQPQHTGPQQVNAEQPNLEAAVQSFMAAGPPSNAFGNVFSSAPGANNSSLSSAPPLVMPQFGTFSSFNQGMPQFGNLGSGAFGQSPFVPTGKQPDWSTSTGAQPDWSTGPSQQQQGQSFVAPRSGADAMLTGTNFQRRGPPGPPGQQPSAFNQHGPQPGPQQYQGPQGAFPGSGAHPSQYHGPQQGNQGPRLHMNGPSGGSSQHQMGMDSQYLQGLPSNAIPGGVPNSVPLKQHDSAASLPDDVFDSEPPRQMDPKAPKMPNGQMRRGPEPARRGGRGGNSVGPNRGRGSHFRGPGRGGPNVGPDGPRDQQRGPGQQDSPQHAQQHGGPDANAPNGGRGTGSLLVGRGGGNGRGAGLRGRGRTPSQMKSIYVAKTTGDRVNGSQG